MSFSPNNAASARLRAAGVAVIAASIAVILTVGRKPLTSAGVEESLKRFADYVATDAAKSGKEGRFTHGAVDMRGWFLTPHALVQDVALEVKKQSLLESVSWVLSTPRMAVVPDQVMARRVYYVFAEPVTVKKNGRDVAGISFSEPLKYGQMESRRGGAMSLIQDFQLPASITLTPLENGEGGPVVISYDRNPTMEIISSLEHSERQAEYAFRNITVTSGAETPLVIGSLRSQLTERPGADGVLDGRYVLTLAALKTGATPKPCDVAADISYTGDQPLMKLAGYVSGSQETAVNMHSVALDCADFKIVAGGTLARSPEDPLPSGQVKLTFENIHRLLASGLLSQQGRGLLTQLLVKVTGQPVDTLTHVEIPLKREKNGTFYVGDVTFEELAASLLTGMLDVHPHPAPAIPAPEAPADAPDALLPDPETMLLEGDMPSDAPEISTETPTETPVAEPGQNG